MSELLSSSTDPPRDPLAEHLRVAIARAFHAQGDRDITTELRETVCGYVREHRAAGTRAEAVVIAVKRIIDFADVRPARSIERRALTERVVTWCINEYYRGD